MIRRKFSFLFLVFGAFSPMLYAASTKQVEWDEHDTRHILKSWPRELVQKLEEYEPPKELQQKIHALTLNEEYVKMLSAIYRYGVDAPYIGMLAVKEEAENKGFSFLGQKHTVFKVDSIPGVVFKMAGRDGELRNLSRVEESMRLRAQVQKDGKENDITIPQKYAYVLPMHENIDYEDQPKILVVAEDIALPRASSPMNDRHRSNVEWLKRQRASDLHQDNIYRLPAGKIAVVDTEIRDAHMRRDSFILGYQAHNVSVNGHHYLSSIDTNGTVMRSPRSLPSQ